MLTSSSDKQPNQVVGGRNEIDSGEYGQKARVTFTRSCIVRLVPMQEHQNCTKGVGQSTDVPSQFIDREWTKRPRCDRRIPPDTARNNQCQQ